MFDGNVALDLKSFTNRLVKLSCTLSVFLVLIILNDIHHNFLDGLKVLVLVEFGRNVDVRISIRPGPE